MKYYAEKYNRTIKDSKQPLLISIAKVCPVSCALCAILDFLF